jgi:hydrogenase expression/formation protein HypE
MDDARCAAERSKIAIIGGHTEITKAVTVPVIVSTAIGKKPAGKGAAKVSHTEDISGASIFVTKPIALEGTAIIASDREEKMRDILTADEIAEAKSLVSSLSVIEDGVLAGKLGASRMHDITEGGVLGAVWEICRASGVGAIIDEASIPILGVTKKICAELAIDPLKLISSGAMLVIAPAAADMPFAKIGKVTPAKDILLRHPNGETTEILEPAADELYKVIK